MNCLRLRPGSLAGPIALSLLLHAAAIVWLHPRSARQAALPRFDLSVRMAEREVAVSLPPQPPPPPSPAARPSTGRAPKAGALPPPIAAMPHVDPLQPELRLRVVADPAEYLIAAPVPGRAYAWPGELLEMPLPADGIRIRYPEDQLRDRERGLVVARLDIAPSGQLERVDIVCGSPPFDAAVLETLQAARFRAPVSAQGQVPAWMVLEFAFLAPPKGADPKDPGTAERALASLQKGCLRRTE